MWPRDMHVKRLHRRPHAPDGFAGPKPFAQNSEPAVFQFANHAKSITRVRGLVRVQTAPGEVALELGVGGQNRLARAQPERFAFESVDQLAHLFLARLWDDDATAGCFAKFNFMARAKI